MKSKNDGLVLVLCRKCGRKLLEVLPDATVTCPKCHVETKAKVA